MLSMQKKEVKSQVVRADQLVKYIKDMYNNSKEAVSSEDKMFTWAKTYLDLHKEVEKDYTEKYEQYKLDSNKTESKEEVIVTKKDKAFVEDHLDSIEELDVFKELKAYRLSKSREEKIKPYFIYNDKQLKNLISKMPRSNDELMSVDGFGKVKVEKYGHDILNIMTKY